MPYRAESGEDAMRLLLITCCALLAGCDQLRSAHGISSSIDNDFAISNLASNNLNHVAASSEPTPEISATRRQLFDLPESNLRTECAAADYYPDRNVPPTFYDYPSPPEFERYLECLLAEAMRDGGRVRLASAGSFPRVGSCASARITWIGSRFGGRPDRLGGTSVAFDNGLSLVAYPLIRPVVRSRLGDEVRVCLHDLPEDCPAFDLRGIAYRTRNLRTGESWVMTDTQHICRGA